MEEKLNILFDTSAINKLSDDSDSAILLAGVKSGYFVRVSGTNLSEVVANPDEARRQKLLKYLRLLIADGECLLPHNRIIELGKKYFERNPQTFNWRGLSIRFPKAENEIVRQDHINNALAELQLDQQKVLGKEFEDIFAEMKRKFDLFFEEEGRPSLHEARQVCRNEGGSLWAIAVILYGGITSASEETVRNFYKAFPPFQAQVIALWNATYYRCVQDTRLGRPSMKSGRLDLMMAVYLPYCDVFVTDDRAQCRCLKEVAMEANWSVSIQSYVDFRKGLSGLHL